MPYVSTVCAVRLQIRPRVARRRWLAVLGEEVVPAEAAPLRPGSLCAPRLALSRAARRGERAGPTAPSFRSRRVRSQVTIVWCGAPEVALAFARRGAAVALVLVLARRGAAVALVLGAACEPTSWRKGAGPASSAWRGRGVGTTTLSSLSSPSSRLSWPHKADRVCAKAGGGGGAAAAAQPQRSPRQRSEEERRSSRQQQGGSSSDKSSSKGGSISNVGAGGWLGASRARGAARWARRARASG